MPASFVIEIIFQVFIVWVALSTYSTFQAVIDNLSKRKTEKTYDARLGELTAEMVKASGELDSVLREMTNVISARRKVLEELDQSLISKESDRASLETTIAELKKIQDVMPVVKQMTNSFEQAQEKRASKDARTALSQNIIFFVLGLVASVPVNIFSTIIQQAFHIGASN